MRRLTRLVVPFLATLVPAVALGAPTLGTWLNSNRLATNADTRAAFGPPKGLGWTSLPTGVASVNIGGVAHPVCVTDTGWAGLGRSKTSGSLTSMECVGFGGTTASGWFFDTPAGKPAPMWLNTSASRPEPRGAIVLAIQDTSRRRVFACQFNKSGGTYVGHIGDDGLCQGRSFGGGTDTASTYLTLVMKGTGPDAQPRYGWVNAGPTYQPHAPSLANFSLSNGSVVLDRVVCQVSEGGHNWPGYVSYGNCEYFSYLNNRTERKTSPVYQVMRVEPGAPAAPWVFNRFGGKAFYACKSWVSINGAIQATMWGFTNNPGTCTNGTSSTDQPYARIGRWSTPVLLALPNADAGAG